MAEFEKDAEEYITKILEKLPSDEREMLKEEIDYLAEYQYTKRYVGDYLKPTGETLLTPVKINLTQSKGLIVSAALKVSPNIKKRVLEALGD